MMVTAEARASVSPNVGFEAVWLSYAMPCAYNGGVRAAGMRARPGTS